MKTIEETTYSVIQKDPTNTEQDADTAERVVQTDSTIFEEEEKIEASIDDSERDPVVTKKPILNQ